MDKRFLLILAALVVVFGGIFWFNKSKSDSSGKTSSSQGQPSNHTTGNNTTGVTLTEFGDYQCPVCGQFYPIVKQVVSTYSDRVSFRFANFPLVQIHKNAMAGARAAEAAGLQGKFWEMHDILFENQNSWSESSNPTSFFEQYAKNLGLDVTKFKSDSASSAVLATINADVNQAQGFGATGTPTFIVNGKKIENPRSVEEFSKVLDDAIATKAKKQ